MRPSAAAPNSLCGSCGHVARWHNAGYARRERDDDNLVERPCYHLTPPLDAACPCRGFEDSGDIAMRRVARGTMWAGSGPSADARTLARNAVLTLLLVAMGLALLYAYRSQTPAVPTVALTHAVSEVQSGQVRRVTITDDRATLELRDGQRQQTVTGPGDQILQTAVLEYNRAHPSDPIDLRYEQTSSTLSVIGSILLSLLPILLIGGFFYFVMERARRRS